MTLLKNTVSSSLAHDLVYGNMYHSSSFWCTIHVCRCTRGGRIVNAGYYIHLRSMSLRSLLQCQVQLIQPCDQCMQFKRLTILYYLIMVTLWN